MGAADWSVGQTETSCARQCRAWHLVKLEEALVVVEDLLGNGWGGCVPPLAKDVVAVRICPLENAPAVYHLCMEHTNLRGLA